MESELNFEKVSGEGYSPKDEPSNVSPQSELTFCENRANLLVS